MKSELHKVYERIKKISIDFTQFFSGEVYI